MDIVPYLSAVILVATIATILLAILSYAAFKLRDKRKPKVSNEKPHFFNPLRARGGARAAAARGAGRVNEEGRYYSPLVLSIAGLLGTMAVAISILTVSAVLGPFRFLVPGEAAGVARVGLWLPPSAQAGDAEERLRHLRAWRGAVSHERDSLVASEFSTFRRESIRTVAVVDARRLSEEGGGASAGLRARRRGDPRHRAHRGGGRQRQASRECADAARARDVGGRPAPGPLQRPAGVRAPRLAGRRRGAGRSLDHPRDGGTRCGALRCRGAALARCRGSLGCQPAPRARQGATRLDRGGTGRRRGGPLPGAALGRRSHPRRGGRAGLARGRGPGGEAALARRRELRGAATAAGPSGPGRRTRGRGEYPEERSPRARPARPATRRGRRRGARCAAARGRSGEGAGRCPRRGGGRRGALDRGEARWLAGERWRVRPVASRPARGWGSTWRGRARTASCSTSRTGASPSRAPSCGST